MAIKRLEDGSLAEPINQFVGNGEAETNITGDARFGIQRGDKTTGATNVEAYTNGAKVADDNPLPVKRGTGSGFATETKQDAINTTIAGLKGSGTPATLEDLEATLEAILAKTVASAATEAKQDVLEATLEAILAKIVGSPSTEAKQDTLNTSIGGVATEVAALKGGGDKTLTELEATLDAILAKIIATPATESKQDAINTTIASLKGSGTPATLEDLKAALDAARPNVAASSLLQSEATSAANGSTLECGSYNKIVIVVEQVGSPTFVLEPKARVASAMSWVSVPTFDEHGNPVVNNQIQRAGAYYCYPALGLREFLADLISFSGSTNVSVTAYPYYTPGLITPSANVLHLSEANPSPLASDVVTWNGAALDASTFNVSTLGSRGLYVDLSWARRFSLGIRNHMVEDFNQPVTLRMYAASLIADSATNSGAAKVFEADWLTASTHSIYVSSGSVGVGGSEGAIPIVNQHHYQIPALDKARFALLFWFANPAPTQGALELIITRA